MKRRTVFLMFLALAVAALGQACGGGGPEPLGPRGNVGPDAAIAFIGRGPDRPSPDVYLVDADSGAVQQLTDTEEIEWWPTWSRDRQRLGFIVWSPPPGAQAETPVGTPAGTSTETPTAVPVATAAPEDIVRRHIVVANADGSDQRPIGDSILLQNYSSGFSWSPDASQIIYMAALDPAQQPLRSKLRVLNVADGSEVPLTEERLGYLPVWSPDGTKVAFGAFVGDLDEEGEGESEIFLMDSDGSNLRQISHHPGLDVHPVWSPDGTRIAWWGEEPQSDPSATAPAVLFMMDVASGEITELGEGSEPAWSPDGQHILFIYEEKPPSGIARAQPDTDIYVLDVETGERRALAPDTAPDRWPTWSPDGQRVAFVSLRDNLVGEIYVVNADGTDLRRLTDNADLEGMLSWAPQ
jgi:Tol biopolymer transport system component